MEDITHRIAIEHDIKLFGKEKVWEIIEGFKDGQYRMFLRRIYNEVLERNNESSCLDI